MELQFQKDFFASGIHCGLRKIKKKRDLALVYSDVLCDAAAVVTQNKVKEILFMLHRSTLKMEKHKLS